VSISASFGARARQADITKEHAMEDQRKTPAPQENAHEDLAKAAAKMERPKPRGGVERELEQEAARQRLESKVGYATLSGAGAAVGCALGAARFAIEGHPQAAMCFAAASVALVSASTAAAIASEKIVDKLHARRQAKTASMEAKDQGPKPPSMK
jgi:hypothetical protein